MPNKEVEAFYPNWLSPDLYLNLRYDRLSTICWFGVRLQADGSLGKESYPPTNLIQKAHQNNVKVVLVLMGEWGSTTIDTVLASPTLQQTVVDNLYTEVTSNNFDGVDIDLEGFPKTNRTNGQSNTDLYNQFITKLRNKFPSSYRLSIDIPAVDWENVFDVATLQSMVNFLMIMGYDYHWQSGPTSGSVAPLNSDGTAPSVINSVNNYKSLINPSKILLGVPYYGYEWPTVSGAREAATTSPGIIIKYTDAIINAATYGRQFDSVWKTPFYIRGQWNQGHYDDIESLGLKYDLVNSSGIGGIGIWALGYDGNAPELWSLIETKFGTGGPPPPPPPPPPSEAGIGTAGKIILVGMGIGLLYVVIRSMSQDTTPTKT